MAFSSTNTLSTTTSVRACSSCERCHKFMEESITELNQKVDNLLVELRKCNALLQSVLLRSNLGTLNNSSVAALKNGGMNYSKSEEYVFIL